MIQANLEQELKCTNKPGFLVIGVCDSLRGNEVFLVKASSLCKYAEENKWLNWDYVMVPMMGHFKGETGEHNIMRVMVKVVTQSGIRIKEWVDCLVWVLIAEGQNDGAQPGPAFCDEHGHILTYSYVNNLFHEELIKVQEIHTDLISSGVIVSDIYNIYRSLRRGATSRATELNYSEILINLHSR